MAERSWSHLVRFRLNNGTVSFGQLITPLVNGNIPDEISVNIATGDPALGNIKQTGPEITIAREMLLAPIATCPIVSVIGVNYEHHMQETGQSAARPTKPIIFYKPCRSLAAPFSTIRVHQLAQECLDYEGELVFQTGPKPVKNISVSEAAEYIVGYTAGCDFSAREGSILQKLHFCFGKSFDHFSPIGPVLVHPSIVGNPPKLSLKTTLNGNIVQDGDTGKMLFDCARILSFMSSATTIEPGTVIFTGSPGGSCYLAGTGVHVQDGDQVTVQIEKIGNLSVQIKFDK